MTEKNYTITGKRLCKIARAFARISEGGQGNIKISFPALWDMDWQGIQLLMEAGDETDFEHRLLRLVEDDK